MNIVWVGCHEEGIPAFKETLEHGKKVSDFITLDEAAFAKRSAGSREYEDYCKEYNVFYHTVSTIKGDEAFEIIKNAKIDLLVVLGWSEILPARLLDIPTIGTVGTHAALLPHNRGSAPINWALIHGEKVTGNTMMWLDPQVDSGAIVDQVAFPITPYDTCKTLYDQVAVTNGTMLMRLIENLEKGIKSMLPIVNETDEPILPRRRPNVHYKPLPMMTAYKELGWDISEFPNAYAYYENLITLPLHTKLSDEDVEYVVENFRDVVKEYK